MAFVIGSRRDDVLVGSRRSDLVIAGRGDDVIYARGGNDWVFAGEGDDTVFAGSGHDKVFGGSGDDVLIAGSGRDLVFGGSGDDWISGGRGDDILVGGKGDDDIVGGKGDDRIFGGSGEDWLFGGSGDDVIKGDSGYSYCGYGHDWGHDDSFDDYLVGGSGDDWIFGQYGDDIIKGGTGNDELFGGSGNDELFGGSGNDWLFGGSGNDWLDGGSGADGMDGGAGDDMFLVDDVGDVVEEGVDEGTDHVFSEIDYTLTDNVEKLTLLDVAGDSITSTFIDFESGFTVGDSIDGQNGWSSTGPFDESVVDDGGNTAWRVSNAVTSGAFGNQPFTPRPGGIPVSGGDPVNGDPNSFAGEGSTGASGSRFYAEFDFKSATGAAQDGLSVTISPDNGSGGRQGFVNIVDDGDGFEIETFDVNPDGTFDGPITIAEGLSYDDFHTLSIEIIFRDGPDNDTINYYLGGKLIHVGQSWEQFYSNVQPALHPDGVPVQALLFRLSSAAEPALDGGGVLFDNVSYEVGEIADLNGTGNELDNMITGNQGDNVLEGLDGDDMLMGRGGDDDLRGGDGEDQLQGDGGNDTLDGGADNDMLEGGAGDDDLMGGDGDDDLMGGDGDDELEGGAGDDDLDGGADTDTAVFSGNFDDYDIELQPDGSFQVTDTRPGSPDGSDNVKNVENLSFLDGDVPLGPVLLFDAADMLVGSFTNVKDAVLSSSAGGTITIAAGEVPATGDASAQIVVPHDLTIIGAGKDLTTVNATADTGNSGDARGWFLVEPGVNLDLSALTLDGDGNKVYQAIRHKGTGDIDEVSFENILFNESGPDYNGTAVAAFGGVGDVNITNSMFSNIGRIGVLYFGAGTTGTFEGNTYTGKGAGDFLDYALDVSNGAVVDIIDNMISGNRGVASVDGSTSAGILVSTFFGPGTTANISGNTIEDSTSGVAIGFNQDDTSDVTFGPGNVINNADIGVNVVGNPTVQDPDLLGGDSGDYNYNGGDQDNTFEGADLADQLDGNDGADTLIGNDGNDTFRGGLGDDLIEGGDGTDTAIFDEVECAYSVVNNIDGTVTVTNIVTGESDTLDSVEVLEFAPGGAGPILVFDGGGSLVGEFATIQDGVNASLDGYTVLVKPGTYNENVEIGVSIKLISTGDSANTIIQGAAQGGSETGTVYILDDTDDVQIGAVGQGFTIVGFDNPANPGLENAAVYVSGDQNNVSIIGNEIVADGEAAVLTEFGATVDGFTVANNSFSGITFDPNLPVSDTPFTANFPWAMLFVGNAPLKSNIVVTDNVFGGQTLGETAGGEPFGNTSVTVDATGATITGNTFATNAGSFGLRARGSDTEVSNNTFDNSGDGNTTGFTLGAAAPSGPYVGNVFTGGEDGDTFFGTPGDDDISGAGGKDALIGGIGDDQINGGDDIDTAIYLGQAADYNITTDGGGNPTQVTDTDLGDGVDEGTDTLTDVENLFFAGEDPVQVFDASGNFVSAHTTIQGAIDDAGTLDGFKIVIGEGEYNEAITVDKELNINGVGDVVLNGAGLGAVSGVTIEANNVTIDPITVTGFGVHGIFVNTAVNDLVLDHVVTQDNATDGIRVNAQVVNMTLIGVESINNGAKGLEVHNSGDITNLVMQGVNFSGNTTQGVRVSSSGQIDGWIVSDSHFDNNEYGWYVAVDGGTSRVENVTVTNTTFDGNFDAGIYAETFRNATFTDVTAIDSGTGPNNNIAFDFVAFYDGTAIDNITFDGFTVQNNTPDDVFAAFRFESFQASSAGLGDADPLNDIVIQNGTIENVERAVRTNGEPGEFTATNVNLVNVAEFESQQRGNEGDDTFNGDLFGANDRDLLEGDASFLPGGGNDTLNGGGGDDVLIGRGGDDELNGGDGTDTAIYELPECAFQVVNNIDGTITVTNLITGDVDTLDSVEVLEFAPGGVGPILVFDASANFVGDFATIQLGVDAASDGFTVLVKPGTYVENLEIVNKSITLLSTDGRGATTIEGIAGSALGTILVDGVTDGLQIGAAGQGFTVIGFDGPPGIEKAALYARGNAAPGHQNLEIVGNEFVANGDSAVTFEFNDHFDGVNIEGNIFSGTTFDPNQPIGDPTTFGGQFTTDNVARQLVVVGGGSGVTNTKNVSFIGNEVTGTSGGVVAEGETFNDSGTPTVATEDIPFGNSMVTIDVVGGSITGNSFTGSTGRFGSGLRARGPDTDIENNSFDNSGGGDTRGIFQNKFDGSYNGNSFTGGDENDFFTGSAGADDMDGNAGHDGFRGLVGDDDINGGAGIDTAFYNGPAADYIVTTDGSGNPIQVEDTTGTAATGDDEGTDTLTSVENVFFFGEAAVQVFDASGAFISSHATIQDAVDAGTTLAGFKVVIGGGTWTESVTVDKALTFVGAGNGPTVLSPAAGSAFVLSGDLGAGNTLSFQNLSFEDSNRSGVQLGSGVTLGTLEVLYSHFEANDVNGIEVVDGRDLGNFLLENSTFVANGESLGASGDGDVLLFDYEGDAIIRNVDITGADRGNGAQENGIQFRGDGAGGGTGPLGTVLIENVTIDGVFEKQAIAFFNYDNLDNLTLVNVQIPADSFSFNLGINADGIAGDIDFSGQDVTSLDPVALQGTGAGEDNTITGRDGLFEILNGKGGSDVLTGGTGTDLFQFTLGESGTDISLADVITDFEDTIDGILLDLDGGGPVTLNFDDSADVTGGVDNDTVISIQGSGEIVAVLDGVNSGNATIDLTDVTIVP